MAAKTSKKTQETTGRKNTAGRKPQSQKKSAASGQNRTRQTVQKRSEVEYQARQERTRQKSDPKIMQECLLWVILAACILVFISYFGIGGYVGAAISEICFGLFGFIAYLLPVLVFLAAAFLISNKGNRLAGFKCISAAMMYLCVCALMELCVNGYRPEIGFARMYLLSASTKTGGGILGGALCLLFCPALGSIGTGILLVVLLIACLVMLSQKSLMAGMRHQSEKMYQTAKDSRERREVRRKEREEERAAGLESEIIARREEAIYRRERWDTEKADRIRLENQNRRMRNEKQKAGAVRRPADSRRQEEYAAAAKTGSRTGRTQLEMPVLFPGQKSTVSGAGAGTGRRGENGRVLGQPGVVSIQNQKLQGQEIDWQQREQKRECREPEPFRIYSDGKEQKWEEETVQTTGSSVLTEEVFQEEEPEESAYGMEKCTETAQEDVFAAEPEEEFEETVLLQETDEAAEKSADGAVNELMDEAAEETETETAGADTKSFSQTESKAQEVDPQEKSTGQKKNPRSTREEMEAGIASVEAEIAESAEAVKKEYVFPPIELLKRGSSSGQSGQQAEIRKTAAKLQQTLNSFGVRVTVTDASCGPSVTRYELLPEQGVKVSKIVSLADDIKLNLAAADIRIEAPIPGKAAVGIEVPNKENSMVMLRDLIESEEFMKHPSKLAFATGKDIGGKTVVSDIAKMPHLLVAGATGSGKSVCINTLIMSILYKAKPDEVKLIMIDPKVVELSVYNGIPHLFIPVVTDPKKAAGALNWGVAEMTDRYNKFAELGVRDIKGYNQKIEAISSLEAENKPEKLPQIIIIVDELADLMMVAPGEVEDSICRLAQLARAAGIHLVIATQRPSVNVITGLIKANMPSRIAFSVSSGVDSRTIIDMNGAEKLLGKGDMLFYPQGYQKPARVQGAFVSDEEVSAVVDFLKNENMDASCHARMEQQMAKVQQSVMQMREAEEVDDLFAEAGRFIIEKDKASIGMLQRMFKIGFNRAARIMDQLAQAGVVGPEEGTKPRKILMSQEQFENQIEQGL